MSVYDVLINIYKSLLFKIYKFLFIFIKEFVIILLKIEMVKRNIL